MTSNQPILSVEGISKSYAGKRVVDHVSFEERRGSILGIVGPNGAGKTTVIRILMGIVRPEEGQVSVLGARSAAAIRQLRYFAALKGVDRRTADQRMDRWLERLGVPDVAAMKVQDLSKGMQQKAQLAATVLHDPDLLLLDEPFAGLDPVSRHQLRSLLRELADEGKTLLLSSHDMAEVEALCPQVVMIHLGRVVLRGRVDAIRREQGEHAVLVRGEGDLAAVEGVITVEPDARGLKVHLADGCRPRDFLARALAAGATIDHFEVALPSLEDVFVRLVKTGGREERRDA